jgi:outer membrane protein insertion porin family
LNDNRKIINIHLDEGNKFFFRHITWVGNTKYSTEELNRILHIQRGDIYNMQTLNARLMMDPNGQDVSSLYLDDGYLFFNVNPKEIKIEGDSIDIEIRIYEGKQARINRVTLIGNTKTSDYVVMREIRTKPGDLFRRSDIIRSQRELAQLKYFNPEKMSVNPKPNPADGTVDIEYIVEEQPSDQVELSAGYGNRNLVGTLGLSFNNFSTKRIFKPKAWTPLPSGDGQTFSIRAQSTGAQYQSYNASFIEPWLGGKKPNSLSVSFSYSLLSRFASNSIINTGEKIGFYKALTASVGYGMRLKWPDDFFNLNIIGTYQHYEIDNYNFGSTNLSDGKYNSYIGKLILTRNSIDQPIYPRSGSNLTFTLQGTLPYSSFMSAGQIARNNLIEYYKMKVQAEWYNKIFGNLVLYTKVNFGVLGRYNSNNSYTQFERFYMGGSPMAFSIDGREIISLRGYNDPTTPQGTTEGVTPANGAVAAVKYSMELRYPISLNPSATIYGLAFMDAGRGWSDVKKISPFEARKAAGVGVRVFMPMFGLLGFDIGYGFDKLPSASWTPTFMLGYNMSGW